MKDQDFICAYFKILRCLGLLPVAYDEKNKRHILSANVGFYVSHGCLQSLFLCSILILVANMESYFLEDYSAIENYYEYATLLIAVSMQLLLNIWLLAMQRRHFGIIAHCELISGRPLSCGTVGHYDYSLVMFCTNGLVCGLHILYFWQSCLVWNTRVTGWLYLPVVCYALHIAVSSFVLAFYACLISAVSKLLNDVATVIGTLLERCAIKSLTDFEKERIQHWLAARDSLLLVCSQDISVVYAVVFLIITFFATFDITSIVHVMTTTSATQTQVVVAQVVQTVVLMLPLCFSLTVALTSNNIQDEANKTAKILSKIPRSGTGMDKMVDKFLMKNLRQKSTLTAYGFFSLDKSTLFKLFTAIFTYMVILVQFKDMESSTDTVTLPKALNN